MIKFKKTAIFILAFVLSLSLLSCAKSSGEISNTEATNATETELNTEVATDNNSTTDIIKDGASSYSLVYSGSATQYVRSAALEINKYIDSATGVQLKYAEDWVRRDIEPDDVSEYEILIGKTNRTASATAIEAMGTGGWCVTKIGNRIVICGATKNTLAKAVEHFKSICNTESGELSLKTEDMKTEYSKNDFIDANLNIKVGSYNIQHGVAVNCDMSVIANDILQMGLDIVGVQEVDEGASRSGGIQTMSLLSQHTEYKYYEFAKAINLQGGAYGTGILSKYPIKSFEVITLESGSNEQRVLGHAKIEINGVEIDFFNTHLSYESYDIRQKQLKQIAAEVDKCEVFVLTADFNTANLNEFSVIEDSRIMNNGKYGSFVSNGAAIDNIIMSYGWDIVSSGMQRIVHSDHYPIYAEIKYTGDLK